MHSMREAVDKRLLRGAWLSIKGRGILAELGSADQQECSQEPVYSLVDGVLS